MSFLEARDALYSARYNYYLEYAREHPILLGFVCGFGIADIYLILSRTRKVRCRWTS